MQKLPEDFLDKLKSIYPPSVYQKILSTFNTKRPTTFRVNLLRSGRREILDAFKSRGFHLQNIGGLEDCFILQNKTLRDLQETDEYREGLIYVQGLSSTLPARILNPAGDESVLDLCAAPGSKTTQLASIMQNRGRIVAVEKIKPRYYKLLNNLKIQGVENTEVFLFDGTIIFKKFSEEFDKILLDAPCSSEARFYFREPRTFSYWKPRKVKEMAHKQRRLLVAALRVLKPGGILVYSTCTFSPEENEEVINYALKRCQGKVQLEDFHLPLTNKLRGMVKWQDKQFDPSLKKTVRVIPDKFFEGFFMARLKKKEPLVEDTGSGQLSSGNFSGET